MLCIRPSCFKRSGCAAARNATICQSGTTRGGRKEIRFVDDFRASGLNDTAGVSDTSIPNTAPTQRGY